jgi:hypothetical protein
MIDECEGDCEAFRGQHEGDVEKVEVIRDGRVQSWLFCQKAQAAAVKAGYEVRKESTSSESR